MERVWGGGEQEEEEEVRGKDPKCFDLRVHRVCGCMNLRLLSLTFVSHTDSLSLPPSSLPPSLPPQGYSLLFSAPGITARFSSFLSEDHVRLFNVSASFVV